MRGQPKYNYGDVVEFHCDDKIKIGVIAIIDKYGTFFDNSDVSYDILNKDEHMLYKHFREDYIIKKVGQVDPNTIWDSL